MQYTHGPLSGTAQVGLYQKRYSSTHTWNVLWESVIIMDFMRGGEDNIGNCTDNVAGYHPIRTIDAPTSIIPQFYAGFPSCRKPPGLGQAPNMPYCIPGGLVTWRLGLIYKKFINLCQENNSLNAVPSDFLLLAKSSCKTMIFWHP